MFKKALLAAALLAAGCSSEAPAPTQAGATTTDPAPVPAASEACPPAGYSATPQGVTLDHAYLVRSDRIYQTRSGGERRRTALELLDGDAGAVAEAALSTLVAQGFRQLEVPERGDGVLRLAVIKRGVGRINISATDDLGANPAHPRAVGVVAFDMPFTPPGADAPSDADAADATDAADDAGGAGAG